MKNTCCYYNIIYHNVQLIRNKQKDFGTIYSWGKAESGILVYNILQFIQ